MSGDVDDLLAEYLDAAARGDARTAEEFLRAHPEAAAALRPRLAALEKIDACMGALRQDAPADEPVPAIAGYRILEHLGQGGMSVVYLAEQESLKRLVALKVLSTTWKADPRTIERFSREARTIAGLSHPGIVAIHHYGEDGGILYLAIDLVAGADLAEIVSALRTTGGRPAAADARDAVTAGVRRLEAAAAKHGARLAAPRADDATWTRPYPEFCARLIKDVAEALDAAHAAGVLHRDVKPSNIILGPDGRPRVIDFGLTLSDAYSALTRPTEFLGSAPYCSPEQISGDARAAGPAGEVFSLGAVFYELLTLKRPFDGKTLPEILARVSQADPADVRAAAPEVPAELAAVCRMAMEKDPRRRYASARAFADDLSRWLDGRPVQARASSSSALVAVAAMSAVTFMVAFAFHAMTPAPAVSPAPAPVVAPKPETKSAPKKAPAPNPVRLAAAAAWESLRADQPEKALASATLALKIAPSDADALKVLGLTLLRLKRVPEAADALDKAMRAAPADVNTRLSLAEALEQTGDADAALKQYELCATLAPGSAPALQAYGGALARKGDVSGAVKQYKKSLGMTSTDTRTQLLVAELLASLHKDEEAVYYFKQAEKSATNDADREAAHLGLARLPQQR